VPTHWKCICSVNNLASRSLLLKDFFRKILSSKYQCGFYKFLITKKLIFTSQDNADLNIKEYTLVVSMDQNHLPDIIYIYIYIYALP